MSTEKVRKTGGNNVPLVEQEADAICIAGNTVDRQPQNGGNGLGCQDDLAYTLTARKRHQGAMGHGARWWSLRNLHPRTDNRFRSWRGGQSG